MVDFDRVVGKIYDCAVNPALWAAALDDIRDAVGAAHVAAGYIDRSGSGNIPRATWQHCHADWDQDWVDGLGAVVDHMPLGASLSDFPLDVSWRHAEQHGHEQFKRTAVYESWFKPQKLDDCLGVKYVHTGQSDGVLAMPVGAQRGAGSHHAAQLAEKLSPHIRRAMSINDATGNGHLIAGLLREVFDQLSVAVFVVGTNQRLMFTNAAGDELLSEGRFLTVSQGALRTRHASVHGLSLDAAVDAATASHLISVQRSATVPLASEDGDIAVAHVLSLCGSDLQSSQAAPQCAVFVARPREQQAMATDILRMSYDMTQAEAKVAYRIARGDNPGYIAQNLLVSVNTVRTHLRNAFSKTNTPDQTALGALINGLLPPII